MDDKIDFYNDINKFSENITKTLGPNIKLDLQLYNNKNIIDLMLKWKMCFELLGKNTLFLSKNIQKIIYCLLSDCAIINLINDTKIKLPLYDMKCQTFLGFDVVNSVNRFIKIKIFNMCDRMVVIDCKNYPNYKIYDLYNLKLIKDYYKSSKVNFDIIIKNICLLPTFVGDVNNLLNDFKKLSINNLTICNTKNLKFVEEYLKNMRKIDTEINNIQNELINIYKNKYLKTT